METKMGDKNFVLVHNFAQIGGFLYFGGYFGLLWRP
jgi:hypothetical protein